MARTSSKPLNRYMRSLIERAGYDPNNLKEAALGFDIPYTTFLGLCHCEEKHQVYESLLRISQATGISEHEFICGLLGKKSKKRTAS